MRITKYIKIELLNNGFVINKVKILNDGNELLPLFNEYCGKLNNKPFKIKDVFSNTVSLVNNPIVAYDIVISRKFIVGKEINHTDDLTTIQINVALTEDYLKENCLLLDDSNLILLVDKEDIEEC